jgi:protein involved in polysaccharide export with SLBB domain
VSYHDVARSYRIAPEDTLLISVWKNDAISRSVIVRPDGKISLPLINDVQAAAELSLATQTHHERRGALDARG